MIITAVEKEKKHLTRLRFDNGAELLVDSDICNIMALRPGFTLDEEEIERLKHDSDYARAKSRALWYLDRGDYTEKAMLEKLQKAGFDGQACNEVIDRLKDLGLIDDSRFAERFAEQCARCNISRREAAFKMRMKGLPADLIDEALDGTGVDEKEQIAALIKKKYRTKLQSENGVQKVYAALIRRGFSFEAVRRCLKEYSEELEYSEE